MKRGGSIATKNKSFRFGLIDDVGRLYTRKQCKRFDYILPKPKEEGKEDAESLCALLIGDRPDRVFFWSQLVAHESKFGAQDIRHGDQLVFGEMRELDSYFAYKTNRRIALEDGTTKEVQDFILVPGIDTNAAGYTEVPPDFADAPQNYYNNGTAYMFRYADTARLYPGSEIELQTYGKDIPSESKGADPVLAWDFDEQTWTKFDRGEIEDRNDYHLKDFEARYAKRMESLKKTNRSMLSKVLSSIKFPDIVVHEIVENLFTPACQHRHLQEAALTRAEPSPKRKRKVQESESEEEDAYEAEEESDVEEEGDEEDDDEYSSEEDERPKRKRSKPKAKPKARATKAKSKTYY